MHSRLEVICPINLIVIYVSSFRRNITDAGTKLIFEGRGRKVTVEVGGLCVKVHEKIDGG